MLIMEVVCPIRNLFFIFLTLCRKINNNPTALTRYLVLHITAETDCVKLISCSADFGGGGYLCGGAQVSDSVTTLGIIACSKGTYARQKAAVFYVLDVDVERSSRVKGGRIEVIRRSNDMMMGNFQS